MGRSSGTIGWGCVSQHASLMLRVYVEWVSRPVPHYSLVKSFHIKEIHPSSLAPPAAWLGRISQRHGATRLLFCRRSSRADRRELLVRVSFNRDRRYKPATKVRVGPVDSRPRHSHRRHRQRHERSAAGIYRVAGCWINCEFRRSACIPGWGQLLASVCSCLARRTFRGAV